MDDLLEGLNSIGGSLLIDRTKVFQNCVRLFVTLFLENMLLGSPYPTLPISSLEKKKSLTNQKDEFGL